MSFFRRLAAMLAFSAILAPLQAVAAPQDAIFNKEGYWGIDVDHGACAASMTLQGRSVFLLRAVNGRVTFGLFGRAPLARGKVVRLETEAYGFDFRASYGDDGASLFYNGDLDAKALAALRLARRVRILADGRQVAAMTFEGTGFPDALDGVVACSQGDSGWWGKGVGAQATDTGPRPDLDNAALVALRRAKWLRVSIDGGQLLDIDLTDTGFAALLNSVAACSKGRKGWWGDGAKRPG
jgi:hypothetical protein